MTKSLFRQFTFGGLMIAAMYAVHAQAAGPTRTWVSGLGDDNNPCSFTAPCKTFAGALALIGWVLSSRRGLAGFFPRGGRSRTGTALLLRPVLYQQARPFRDVEAVPEPVRTHAEATTLRRS